NILPHTASTRGPPTLAPSATMSNQLGRSAGGLSAQSRPNRDPKADANFRFGRVARLQESLREGPDSGRKPAFQCARQIGLPEAGVDQGAPAERCEERIGGKTSWSARAWPNAVVISTSSILRSRHPGDRR